VVTKPDAIFHENMLTKHWREGQHHQVDWRSNERPSNQADSTDWVLENISTPQHRAFEKITAFPTLLRNGFVHDPVVAPVENMTQARHAHKEVLVLTTAPEFWVEDLLYTLRNQTSEQ
jgi:hypothetical protein